MQLDGQSSSFYELGPRKQNPLFARAKELTPKSSSMAKITVQDKMFIPWARFFTPEASQLMQECIELALAEDGPDLTAEGIFAPDERLSALIRSKEDSLVAGLPLIGLTLKALQCPFSWKPLVAEGAFVPAFTELACIEAPASPLLKAERVILNFITHLSGVANLTARYVAELSGTGVRLLDTRKTTPGMRWAEKYAVQLAGGTNHRRNLTEMLMLKDNHIDAAGSIKKAVEKLRNTYQPCPPIEVECRKLEDVEDALASGAERIMLDNMGLGLLSEALSMIPPAVEAEVSGGVKLENIRAIARTGPRQPDFISVGRLTHSAVAADFSMTLAKTADNTP